MEEYGFLICYQLEFRNHFVCFWFRSAKYYLSDNFGHGYVGHRPFCLENFLLKGHFAALAGYGQGPYLLKAILAWQFFPGTILVRDHLGQRPSWSATILVRDHLGQGPFWPGTILARDHFGQGQFCQDYPGQELSWKGTIYFQESFNIDQILKLG